MTKLELSVRLADGTSRVAHVERDDAVGRRSMDAVAFAYLARANVERVSVARVTRSAQRGRTYR